MMRFATLALLVATPLAAQSLPSALPNGSEIITLSPAEKQATLDAAARSNSDPLAQALNGTENPARDRKPHGEVGMFVGTGGARGIFGSTIVPLGENGSAAFSFSTGRMPGYYDYSGYGVYPGRGHYPY